METKYRRLKLACYTSNISMSVVGNLSPILFLIFRERYNISYSLLGLLILMNFVPQLSMDLLFSFFSHKFNIQKTVVFTPLLTVLGLTVYALWPCLFPESAYTGLLIGTMFFSASGGLSEALISPVVAAIPSENPDREMSKLHAIYAWGVVFVIIFGTLFLKVFGRGNWYYLALIFTLIPLFSFILYFGAAFPNIETGGHATDALALRRNKIFIFCVLIIFFGGASEVIMAQWSSSFLEKSLGISKVWGDIFGVALYSATLGLGRSLYSKIGKNITKVLLWGIIGAAICYLTVAVCNVPIIGLIACALTGLCVSMLWPGSLIVASDHFPTGGVFLYAMMAAGGDFGASVAPQLIGVVTDAVIRNPAALTFAQNIGLSSEQLGMKLGMLVGALFPLLAIPLYVYMHKKRKN